MKDRYDDIYSSEEDIEAYYDTEKYYRQDNAYRITSVNEKRISTLRRKAVKRVALFGMVAVGIFSVYKLTNNPEPQSLPVPDGYQEMYVQEEIDKGETLEQIAQKYYTEDVRTCYPDFNEYMKIILKDNEIKEKDLDKKDSINVPIIIDNNNYYLTEIKSLEEQLKNIEEWINYTVKAGDTISEIAWESASNGDEAINNTNRMIEVNHLKGGQLQIGQHISIINPEIGKIKREIESLRQEFNESITIDYGTKSK